MSVIVVLLALLAVPAARAQTADLLVENAVVYTVNPAQPRAKSIAISKSRILAVGDDLSRYADARTRRIDAKGAAVIPGLIDAHVHMRGLGELLESQDLRHVPTTAAVADIIRREAARRGPGEWIVMRNWDQTNWGGAFPKARDLDEASGGRPVFLSRVDGHAGWVNTRALELAGVTKESRDPPGGKIIRDAGGNPTGVLIDRAMGLVRAHIPPAGATQVKRQLELAARECARLGLTSVHDAGVSSRELSAYRELIREDKLPVRVYAMIGGEGELWREYLKKGPETGEYLTVRSIKLFSDGALGSSGAALWQDYSDEPGNQGLLLITPEALERVARDGAAKGFQVCTHAIGDRANRLVLDAYAAVLGGRNDKRFRIEHAQVVSLPDFQRFADFSLIASMQATHATSDMRWAARRLGPDRVTGAYAWQRFLKIGVPVANGSDFPVEEANPMLGLYAAITRQDLKGEPAGGWHPDQRMTREQALKSWTLDGAYAAFEEKDKGSLEPGKMADLLILDRDIMTAPAAEIPRTQVKTTILGGRVVHQAP
ncbi:MAG: amidohydrolase [Bryobacteraceae bacterium]|nr:amidohydrolase [Bryobacteraceae bacterium]